jgi:hypothetical protein
MALVKKLEKKTLERESKHTEAECTYSVFADDFGEKYLQIDTYGSKDRQEQGKQSQTIRFSPDAIKQLKIILQGEFS